MWRCPNCIIEQETPDRRCRFCGQFCAEFTAWDTNWLRRLRISPLTKEELIAIAEVRAADERRGQR